MLSMISQCPFSFTQRAMYFPESGIVAPGGRLAPGGTSKCQRPISTTSGPLVQTDSGRTPKMGGGLDVSFMCARKMRIACRPFIGGQLRSEEHTSELQSRRDLVCRLLLEKKKKNKSNT